MPILACLVARGNVVLAEYNPSVAAFSSIARRLIDQIPANDNKKSYSYDNYNFHYVVEKGITYLCMSDTQMGMRIPYSFLVDIANRFRGSFGERINTAGPLAFNDTFSRVLQERVMFYSNDRNADKISRVKGEIEDAKVVMVKNIDKVLERGEKIEILVDKTEDLNNQAQSFKVKSKKLKRKMWWQNTKMCIVLVCIVLAILSAIVFGLLYYFGVFSGTPRSHDATTTTTTTSTSSTTGAATASSLTSSTSSTSTGGSGTTGAALLEIALAILK